MEAMNDGLTYALVFGIVFLGGLLIVLLVRLVFDIRERIKQKDLDDLRLKCKELKAIRAMNLYDFRDGLDSCDYMFKSRIVFQYKPNISTGIITDFCWIDDIF